MEKDFAHAEMFPYAIALAKREGATSVLIGEPRLRGSGQGWICPDVLGIKPDGRFVIVECEKSHGNIFDNAGKIDRWSQDAELRTVCEFHFILSEEAWYRREQIRKFFGTAARIYRLRDLASELRPVRI